MTMLDRMRRHKSWLKWSLGLVVLAFVIFYIPDFLQQQPATVGATSREIIADVGGHPLTVGDFQARYRSQVQSYRTQFGGNVDESLLRQLGIEQQVIRQMVEEQVAAIEAERLGIQVSNEELAQQIVSLPVFQDENGGFIGEARYQQILQAQTPPLSISEFEESMRRSMVLDKLRGALTDWVAVADADLEREYKKRNEKVKLQLVVLTADAFRNKVTVSDADVTARYESHKAEYRVGEQRKIRFLLLDQDQARLKVAVTPGEIQRDYNNNIARYQTPEQIRASHILLKTEGKSEATVRAQAEEILKQVKGGADFAALAKKVSEDESKTNGGDLDYFSRGRMVPEFDTAAFALQPGQTSELVKSQFGFHIIRVTDRKPEVTRPLEEVRTEIQDRLTAQKANQQVIDRAGQLAERIKSPEDLDKAAVESGTKIQESDFFTRDSPIPGLGVAPEAASTAFRLNDKEIGGPVATPRGPAFLMVSQKKDPYVPMLDEVKERVREDVIRARAAEMSQARAREVAESLRAARDFTAAAKAQGVEAKETALIARGSALPEIGMSPEVDKVAFSLPVNGVSDAIATSEGTVIVRVTERDEVTPDELKKGRESFRAELLLDRRDRFFNAYMTKRKEKTAIEIKSDVMRRVLNAMAS